MDPATFLEALPDGAFRCDPAGHVLYANPSLARTLGYSREELLHKSLPSDLLIHGMEWEACRALLESQGQVVDYEVKFRRADGMPLSIAISARVVRGPGDALVAVEGTMRDITVRRGLEDEAVERAEHMAVMGEIAWIAASNLEMEQANAAIFGEIRKLVDCDAMLIATTEELSGEFTVQEVWGRERGDHREYRMPRRGTALEQVVGSGNWMVRRELPEEESLADLSALRRAEIRSVICVPIAYRGRRFGVLGLLSRKGEPYSAETAELLQEIADRMSGAIENARLMISLNERNRVRASLVETALQLQSAIESAQIYELIAKQLAKFVPYRDLSFYVVDWSRRQIIPVYAAGEYTEEILAAAGGVDEGIVGNIAHTGRAEIIEDADVDPRVAQIPGVPPTHDALLVVPLVAEGRVIGVLEAYRPKGAFFSPKELELATLFAQQAAVALDNSRLIRELQESKNEIELLNDLMFHDMNNYNQGAMGYLGLLRDLPRLDEKAQTYLTKAFQLVKENSELIENVRKLSRIRITDGESFQAVEVGAVLREKAEAVRLSQTHRRVDIRLALPAGPMHTRADSLIGDLFLNLLTNAVKYDPHEVAVVDIVGAEATENGQPYWKIGVIDRGSGIPEEKKKLLFRRFTRLVAEGAGPSGTGLGLSIVRALAEKYRGRVWAEDRVPGDSSQGTIFYVMLPKAG